MSKPRKPTIAEVYPDLNPEELAAAEWRLKRIARLLVEVVAEWNARTEAERLTDSSGEIPSSDGSSASQIQ